MRRILRGPLVAVLALGLLPAAGCDPALSLGDDDDDDSSPDLDWPDPEQVPGVDDPAADLFDGDGLPEFHLEIPPDSMALLEDESWEELYNSWDEYVDFQFVEATLTYEGREIGPVGVRMKGQGSFQPIWGKPSLKLDFDEFVAGGAFLGLERLTLNNMASDPSMAKERLGYHVMQALDQPASRCDYALVYVNDEFKGVYANVESVDRDMIGRWFDDTDGSLFEGWDTDFYVGWTDMFELEFGPDDRTNLEGLAAALENEDPEQAMDEAAEFLDVDGFVGFWSAIALIGHYDGYPYHYDDFHVYDDPTSGTLWFIPWGMDESFNPWATVVDIAGIVALQCAWAQWCLEDWFYDLRDRLDTFEALELDVMLAEEAERIGPWVEQEELLPYEFGLDSVAPARADLDHYIVNRRATLMMELGVE